jgi:hypothetical protein
MNYTRRVSALAHYRIVLEVVADDSCFAVTANSFLKKLIASWILLSEACHHFSAFNRAAAEPAALLQTQIINL